MAIGSFALKKSVAGIEAGRPCNQNPSSSPTRFPLKLKLLQQTKTTKLPIEFHSNPLHTLNILPFAPFSCSVSVLFHWLDPSTTPLYISLSPFIFMCLLIMNLTTKSGLSKIYSIFQNLSKKLGYISSVNQKWGCFCFCFCFCFVLFCFVSL